MNIKAFNPISPLPCFIRFVLCPIDFDAQKQAYFKKIQDMHLHNPCMVGFGIHNKQTFDAACAHSSGAIIGSRFVSLLNECEGDAEKAIGLLKEGLK